MCWWEWIKASEPIALWVEGIALVFIFGLELKEYKRQSRDRVRQEQERIEERRDATAPMEIWRKQIHADRVAEIFRVLRGFRHAVSRAIDLRQGSS